MTAVSPDDLTGHRVPVVCGVFEGELAVIVGPVVSDRFGGDSWLVRLVGTDLQWVAAGEMVRDAERVPPES